MGLIIGIALPSFGRYFLPPTKTNSTAGTQITNLQTATTLDAGATYTDYATTPPTSGPSYAQGVAWGAHDTQQPDEAVVRNLSEGGIIVDYNLTDQTEIGDLMAAVQDLAGYPACYVVQPYSAIGPGQIVFTAWGWTQTFTSVDTNGMNAFADAHRANDAPFYVDANCGYQVPASGS